MVRDYNFLGFPMNKTPCKSTAFCQTTNEYRSASAYQPDQEEQDNCAQNRNDQAGEVEAGHALRAEGIHDEASDQGTDNTDYDVRERAHLGVAPHDDAGNPSSNGTEDDPQDDVHYLPPK